MKDRISQLMKQQGMTQKEFARELCVAEATVSAIFNGRTRPTNQMVAAIHERFPEVSIPWLMFGEGSMYIDKMTDDASSLQNEDAANMPLPQTIVENASNIASSIPPTVPIIKETIKYIDKPQRKITEIRVFFDDGTYETFSSN